MQNQVIERIIGFAAIAVSILVVIGLPVAVLFGFRKFKKVARTALAERYEGLQVHASPQSRDVCLVYHTYHGIIVWFTQTTHRVYLPPDDARELLRRLFWFNIGWGWSAYLGLFVIPLSLFNYYSQQRSISAQETANAIAATNQ